jgi:hypothetical protein
VLVPPPRSFCNRLFLINGSVYLLQCWNWNYIYSENFHFSGYYAATIGNSLPTFLENLSCPSSWNLLWYLIPEGGTGMLSRTSVSNYHYSMRSNPEERNIVYFAAEAWNHVNFYCSFICFYPIAQHPLAGQGLLAFEALRSQSDTLHSVGLWTSDQPDIETSTWQHSTQHSQRDIHPCRMKEFEPAIPRSELPHTHALERATSRIGV